jgi:hypothetical protein
MGAMDSLNPLNWSIWRYFKLLIITTVAFFVANVRTEDGMTALMTAGSVLLISYFAV